MGVTWIDIDAMGLLVPALKRAIDDAVANSDVLYFKLDEVWLSRPEVNRWRWNGERVAQLNDIRLDLQARLDRARKIAETRAGFPLIGAGSWGSSTASMIAVFGDDADALTGAERAAQLLDDILNGRIKLEDGFPAELLDLLTAGTADDGFTTKLVELVPPEQLARILNLMDIEQGNRITVGDTDQLASYQADYAGVLDCFGVIYSRAAELYLPGAEHDAYRAQWRAVFAGHVVQEPYAALLSMVVGRGSWPSDFLTSMKEGIESAETGAGFWTVRWGPNGVERVIIDPGRSYDDSTPVQVADPMYGVWSAAVYNPQWFLDTYQGNDLTEVVFDRAGYDGSELNPFIPQHAMVDSELARLLLERGIDRASFMALLQAASMANMWQSFSGDQPTVMTQLQQVLGSIERDHRLWEDLPFWEQYKHEILAAISFAAGMAAMVVPGPGWVIGTLLIGSTLAAAVDVGIYIAEGDITNAVIAGAFLVPILIGGTIRLVQVTREAWQILEAGGSLRLLGGEVKLYNGKLLWIGKHSPDLTNPGGHINYHPVPGSTDGGPGTWEPTTRKTTSTGMPNQIAQSGVQPTVDGIIIEYKVYSPTQGRTVEFDNYIMRGDPPAKVFQEFKGDYHIVNESWTQGGRGPEIIEGWVDQAWGQYQAILDSGITDFRLEWFISTPNLDDAFRAALIRRNFPMNAIHIYNVPLRR